jgi:hypothetical protein
MSFFNSKLTASRYFNIIKNKNLKFSKSFILKNTSAFIGDSALFKLLFCFEMINKTKNIKGDIIEFGVWNGNNLLAIKKIIDYFNLKKKVFGYDHFKGMPLHTEDRNRNSFVGNIKVAKYFINFFRLKKIQLINDNFFNLKKHLEKFNKFSIIYIDCDIYETTKIILDYCSPKLSKGGLIVFDEGNQKKGTGETKAAREFLRKNKKNYKRVLLKNGYQPDIYFKKIL